MTGQGNDGIYRQIAADAVGVDLERVRLIMSDTDVTPYGGGTWASRGAGVGGEAVLLAGQALRANILKTAAVILKRDAAGLQVRRGHVVDADPGTHPAGQFRLDPWRTHRPPVHGQLLGRP
jgi:carbon-monoxide dehydrogenase large subunit